MKLWPENLWPFGGRRAEERARSLEDPSVPVSEAWADGDDDVVMPSVTPETMMEVAAVWCGVAFLSNTIAALPLHLYRRGTDGSAEKLSGDPLSTILQDAVNEETHSFGWRKQMMVGALTHGRAFTFIERDGAGRVRFLWPLEPDRVTVQRVWDAERRIPRKQYVYANGSARVVYKASEIIDLPLMIRADGVSHEEVTRRLKDTLGLSIALTRYAARHFARGGVPLAQVTGNFQSPAAMMRAAKDLADMLTRAARRRLPLLPMPAGHEVKSVGIDPEKSQLAESRRFQVEEIARIFSLPPVFLQDLSRGTFSNTEQQDLHLVKHTLTSWVKHWEQELDLKLFGMRKRDRYVKLEVDGLLRGDFKTRMEGYAIAIQNSMRTPNEVRALEDLEALEGGDRLMIQQNMAELQALGVPQPAEPGSQGNEQ